MLEFIQTFYCLLGIHERLLFRYILETNTQIKDDSWKIGIFERNYIIFKPTF
jgi:hypothetical protein